MIKLQPELVLMVVIVCKQTEIRQLLQGINREEFHFPGLQFLVYNDEDDTNNNYCHYYGSGPSKSLDQTGVLQMELWPEG